MKYGKKIAALIITGMLFSGCGTAQNPVSTGKQPETGTVAPVPDVKNEWTEPEGELQEDVYAGYADNAPADFSKVKISCLEGTEGCYFTDGSTLTFTDVAADSVYAISGEFKGNIVIDTGDDYNFDLELHGVSFSCDSTNPVYVKSGDRVTITAKKGYRNYVYDMRETIEEGNSVKAGAIYSDVDLRIAGKGELMIVSQNNNGIHSKKDLHVKNLKLTVECEDNALKGNDSVTLVNATTVLIARAGDGIKTTKSDVSGKGKQRGIISVAGGNHTVYAACDGMDAAYNVVIEEETTVLNIYTDKYSGYSEEVVAVAEDNFYLRAVSKEWNYSVKYYNSEEDVLWVNPEYHSEAAGGRNHYYFYSFPKRKEYAKIQVFIYSDTMEQGQEAEYLAATDYLSINEAYDTLVVGMKNNRIDYKWTNYTTKISDGFGGRRGPGGFGGFNEGNSDKGEYSTKGIKAANEIVFSNGTINIKSYDDAVHADNEITLENGETAKGNVTIAGGILNLYSNDDGLHADGAVEVKNGQTTISHCYEGIEGNTITISGGKVSVNAADDGMNATTATGNAVTISGGEVYVYCTGDGIDSNSRTPEEGIIFSGGDTLVISDSGMNSAIDTEQGYRYEGGRVVAVMPNGGMSREAMDCRNFSVIGSKQYGNLSSGKHVGVYADNKTVVTFEKRQQKRMPMGYVGTNREK